MNQNNTLFDQKGAGWAKHEKVSGPKMGGPINWVGQTLNLVGQYHRLTRSARH